MSSPQFSDFDELDELDGYEDLSTLDLEDQLDELLDSPTDFDEYVMNEDDCCD